MIRETITYTDLNGNERTEEFLFHFSKAEIVEMELTTPGGLSTLLDRIAKENDVSAGIKYVKDFILKAYGEKSPDGVRFVKSPEKSEAFYQTEAYSQLFMKLVTDSEALVNFVNGVIGNDAEIRKAPVLEHISSPTGNIG